MKFNKLMQRGLVFSLLLISFSVTFISCSDEDKEDEGIHFYEGTYTDVIAFKAAPGEVHVIIEQIPLAPRMKENIPYSIYKLPTDSTRLMLFVSYGNYSPEKPKVYKDVTHINDSIFIWYTNREKMLNKLRKTNSINEAENDIPKPAYIRIDSIAVFSDSYLWLTTRTLR